MSSPNAATPHTTTQPSSVVAHEPSLGRRARQGAWTELAEGTFTAARRAIGEDRWDDAASLAEVSVLEAEELCDVYDRWPLSCAEWILTQGVRPEQLAAEQARLAAVLGEAADSSIGQRWPEYVDAVDAAAGACRAHNASAVVLLEDARRIWQNIHDDAVDLVSGVVDVAVRLVGEDALGSLWDYLMDDWYEVHEDRYNLENQDWPESARQLAVAIFDGFHAHLTGPDRSGAVEVIEEPDRIGFRFAPCGSGGRSLAGGITAGQPRAAAPYDFAVTTRRHDWAWNTIGICSYCVHCCQLNEVMPIDRLGYPTRVIDAPTWKKDGTGQDDNPACTWWIYRHPSLVPDEVYSRVGRSPRRRPDPEGARE